MFLISKKYRAVFFDLNGTLIRDHSAQQKAFSQTLKAEGVNLTEKEYTARVTNHLNQEIWPAIFQHHLSAKRINDLSQRKEATYLHLVPSWGTPTPGAKELLLSLRQKAIPTALVTSAPHYVAEKLLVLLDLNGLFDSIVCGDNLSHGKPDPEIYLTALRQMNQPAEVVIAFEDSPQGIIAARKAGIDVVGVLPEYPAEVLKKAGASTCIEDFTQVSINPT